MLDNRWMRRAPTLLLALAAALPAAGAQAPAGAEDAAAVLDRAGLAGGGVAVRWWRFRAGDDPAWAEPGFDDAGWERRDPVLFRRGEPLPAEWSGIGWLRAPIRIAPELVGTPIALRLSHQGAAEVFLDGRRVAGAGVVGAGPGAAGTVPRYHRAPEVFVPERAGEHLLAVRFANRRVPAFLRAAGRSALEVTFDEPAAAIGQALATSRFRNRAMGWFCGLFLAFGVLHLLLFLFHRAIPANLDFALLCAALAGLVFLLTYRYSQPEPRFFLFSEPAMNVFGLLFGFAFLRFVYRVFRPGVWRPLALYALLALPVAAWGVADPAGSQTAIFLLMLAATLEAGRTVALAAWRRRMGARLLGVGVLSLAAGFGGGLLAYLEVAVPRNQWTTFLLPFTSFVVLLGTMSIYLSRHFAAVHRELGEKLAEVERLSAEKLEQERLRRQREVENSVLETRYQEKLRELEEARELQLSMLPRSLPELSGLELAAHMETATEVGGDYYDFELDEDGGLILAIGDATGHGMRAGTMVGVAKGLFGALAVEHPLLGVLSRSTLAIKRMRLRKLAMALLLARYRDGELRIASAGMPPALVRRAASGEVEQVLLEGMPLGLMPSFPYRQVTVALGPGDAVLLMSDGLAERLDPAGEPLGYERAAEAFAAAAGTDAAAAIERLRHTAESWAGGRPADDDLTLLVLAIPAP